VFIVFGVQHGIDIPPAKHIYRLSVREQEANIFASNLLLPDELLNRLDVSELRSLTYKDYDDFFQDLKRECCVSVIIPQINHCRSIKTIQNHAPIYAVCGFSNYPNKY
jgi:Zn-dependent peptidase ImmA (M78 family)